MQIMRDPVMLSTGQSYDRPCIERWLRHGNATCPATGIQLDAAAAAIGGGRPPAPLLVPNVALRSAIEEWAESHAPWLLVRGGAAG